MQAVLRVRACHGRSLIDEVARIASRVRSERNRRVICKPIARAVAPVGVPSTLTVGIVGRILRGTIKVERDKVKVAWGERFAFGVGVPLFIGAATGLLVEGVAVSGGALMVGLTDSGAPYRSRIRAMFITCVSVSICTFVGQVAGNYSVITVALLALASFGAGMFIAIDLATYFVALMAPLTMTLVSALPADAVHSLEHAVLVFAGGLFAIAIVLVSWRAHAHLPERLAIAKVYRSLEHWASDAKDRDERDPVLLAQSEARETLNVAQGPVAVPGPAAEAFRVLVDEADRTYLDLVALRNARKRIETWDPTLAERAFDVGRIAAAEAFSAVAQALETRRWSADAGSIRDRLDQSVTALRNELENCRTATGEEALRAHELEDVLSRGASVRAELRGAVDLATTWQGEGAPPDPVRHRRPRRRDLELRHPIPILRANVNLRSSAFRHALRLAVTVGIAAAIDRAFGLPRGYWIPLTVLFVLRPDFGATFTRGLQRYVGTALGVVLATLITAALHPGSFVLAALITALSFCFCALIFANYGLFTLSITACIIFFVSYAGPHNEYATALDRLLDTTIGATLTLGIYALWPTWERALLPDTTAELIEADRGYLSALLQAWLDPASHTREEVASARAAARLARTNTAASVQRALLEPTGRYTAFGTDQATGILSSTRRFADGALALEAYLEDDPPPAPPEARTLAVQLDATFDELACAAREHRAPGPLPPLRQTQQALAAVAGQTSPLAEETDRMVNSALIASHVLARVQMPVGAAARLGVEPAIASTGG